VPQLTQDVLRTTNSWHLLRRLDVDETERARLTGRVHEHLKGLRKKILRVGLAPKGTRIPPGLLVELLVAVEALTVEDLTRLSDQPWLEWQEAHWWSE
jgi:hypothetical protein